MLLGLFGAEDQTPSRAEVAGLEQALKASGKTSEFHSYEGAGHEFFAADRRSYRAEARGGRPHAHPDLARQVPGIGPGW